MHTTTYAQRAVRAAVPAADAARARAVAARKKARAKTEEARALSRGLLRRFQPTR